MFLNQLALEFMTAVNFTVDPCNKDTWLNFACTRRVNGPDNINQVERLLKVADVQTQGNVLHIRISKNDCVFHIIIIH